MTRTPGNSMAVMAHRVTPKGGADLFLTQPWAGRAGAEIIRRLDPAARSAWEPACGPGTLAHGLAAGFDVVHASDAYLYDGNRIHDFLGSDQAPFGGVDWIVTNPPFEHVAAFIRQALRLARRGVAMLLRLGCLDGIGRHDLFYGADTPLTVVAPFSERVAMMKGRYEPNGSTAAHYAWFIFLQPALKPARFMARIPDGSGGMLLRPGVIDIPPGTKKRLFQRSDLRFAVDGAAQAIIAEQTAKGMPVLAPSLLDLLARVAIVPGGVTPLAKVYPAGLLATLKGMGLVAPGEVDPVFGDRKFTVTDDGRVLLRARAVT